MASRVLSAYRGSVPREPADVSVLTDRELDVLRSVGRGLNNREAAAELFVSEATLKTHLRLVLTKLDLRDRSAAIVFAHDNDILQNAQTRGGVSVGCGARKLCRGWSGSVFVLVDESVAAGRSEHCDAGWHRWRLVERGFGRPLFEGPVSMLLVVVRDVVDDEAFELTAVPDDDAVEELASDRSDPALCEGVRDREEVTRDRGLGSQKLGPGHLRAFRRRVNVVVAEDLPHGCLGDLVTETDKFAMDPAVAPGRVLFGETHDQAAQLGRGWWPAWAPTRRLGPVPGDAPAVPAQQRLGCDDPAMSEAMRECHGDRAEQGAVVVGEGRPVDLATEYLNLVTQHDDLEVLRTARTECETSEGSNEAVQDSKHDAPGWRHPSWSASTRQFPSPTRSQRAGGSKLAVVAHSPRVIVFSLVRPPGSEPHIFCIAFCIAQPYPSLMPQLVTRVDDDLAAAVDRLVEAGVVASRSEAVRFGLEQFVDRFRRAEIGERIARGYREHPQTGTEVAWADESSVRMIAEEPW